MHHTFASLLTLIDGITQKFTAQKPGRLRRDRMIGKAEVDKFYRAGQCRQLRRPTDHFSER